MTPSTGSTIAMGDAPSVGGPDPPLSVVILAFGRREFLLAAVHSAVNQTLAKDRYEVLVVKNFVDPSIDRELAALGIPSLQMEETSHGGWVAHALERGHGQVFVFLDDDDLFLPEKLELVLHEFSRAPTLGYYHNGFRVIGNAGAEVESPTPPHLAGESVGGLGPKERPPKAIEALWHSGAAFNLSSISVRRSLLESSLPFLRQVQLGTSAFLYWAAVVSSCAILSDPRVLTEYRVHAGNASGLATSLQEERWRREIRRAPQFANDCGVILDLLRTHGTAPSVRRSLEVEERRYQLLAAVGADPRSRWSLAVRMISLFLASFPGLLWGSRGHFRLGLGAFIGPSHPARPSSR
ncbi:MAG: glycosyltransferase family 2 protein [Thermoplasmata archaeon]